MRTFFAALAAMIVWDFIKVFWWSWRKIMNRDYDGAWWPTKPTSSTLRQWYDRL